MVTQFRYSSRTLASVLVVLGMTDRELEEDLPFAVPAKTIHKSTFEAPTTSFTYRFHVHSTPYIIYLTIVQE